jgi:hypothetical protein
MNVSALRWLLITISAAPFQTTDEARYKGGALIEVADRLDEADEKAKAEAEAIGKE